MSKHIQISLTAKNDVAHEQRKAYLHSLYGNMREKKKGAICKFCGSIGFKPVLCDPYTEFPILREPKISSPDSYITPEQMLYNALNVNLANNGIINFTVPIGVETHPVAKYSYDREEICKKFAKFLEKVYPDAVVGVSFVEDFEMSVKDFVLDHFYQNMDFDDDIYTVECSSHRLLTEKEIEEIYQDIGDAIKYGWKIDQFYCETCKNHNPDAPYHIMVAYDSDNN